MEFQLILSKILNFINFFFALSVYVSVFFVVKNMRMQIYSQNVQFYFENVIFFLFCERMWKSEYIYTVNANWNKFLMIARKNGSSMSQTHVHWKPQQWMVYKRNNPFTYNRFALCVSLHFQWLPQNKLIQIQVGKWQADRIFFHVDFFQVICAMQFCWNVFVCSDFFGFVTISPPQFNYINDTIHTQILFISICETTFLP